MVQLLNIIGLKPIDVSSFLNHGLKAVAIQPWQFSRGNSAVAIHSAVAIQPVFSAGLNL